MEKAFDFLKKIERRPDNLILGLQLIQTETGYVSEAGLRAAAEYFDRDEADVKGVVHFYTQFKRVRPGKFQIAVCDGSTCHRHGGDKLCEWLRQELGLSPGETTADGRFSLAFAPCLGSCSQAPVLRINNRVFGKLDRRKLLCILKEYREK